MAAWAFPARDGDFFYSGDLYVDVGNNKHYARASVAELVALLRPDTASANSRGRRPIAGVVAKDPAWHFYTAQLIHYDLPFTKAKNTAKVRLLNAINQARLEVPRWILKMERELGNEWEDNVRKMSITEPSFSDEESMVFDQLGLSFGNPTKGRSSSKGKRPLDDALSFTPAAKRAAKVKAEGSPCTIIKKEPKATPRAAAIKQEPGSTSKTTSVKQEPKSNTKSIRVKQEPNLTANTPRVKQETKSTIKVTSVKQEPGSTTCVKQEPGSTTCVKQEPGSSSTAIQVKQEPGSPPTTIRVKRETEVSPKSSPVKREPSSPLRSHIKPEANAPSASSKSIVLSGLYDASFVSEDGLYDDDAYGIFELSRSPITPRLWWVNINWGPFEGLIRMNTGLDTIDVHDTTYIVKWRLRHIHTQSVTFGRKCTGEIRFYQDQTFDGVLFEVPDVGNVHMQGRRTPWGSLEGDFQDDWDDFADEA